MAKRERPTLPLAAVLGESCDVQAHLSTETQLHTLHTCVHGPHQRPGLLTAQSLAADSQPLTLETGQGADYISISHIFYFNP